MVDENKLAKDIPHESNSFWIASTSDTNYGHIEEDTYCDVAIAGGGITGITCAYLLDKAGMKVCLVEANRLSMGTTGHTTAKVTVQHDLIYDKLKTTVSKEAAQIYFDANNSALEFIRNLVNEHKIDCNFEDQPSYVYTLDEKYIKKIEDEVNTAKELGIKAEFTTKTDIPYEVKAAVKFENQAQFHPRRYLLELLNNLSDNTTIYENTRCLDIHEEENEVIVYTDRDKKIHAKKVIVATHFPFYDGLGFYSARIYIERSYALAYRVKDKVPKGMYISYEEPARSIRTHTDSEGTLLILGGEHHRAGVKESTIGHYANLSDYAKQRFNLEDAAYRWSTQDCMSMDDIPYIGRITSGHKNIYIATGYKKWGMTSSTAAGLLLRDLIVKGNSPWEETFSPSRTNIAASAKNFVVENAKTAQHLIGGKIQVLKEDLNINIGEAKAIEHDGGRVGVYKDEEGKVHAVDTTCKHLGCEVNWNDAEKTWDCPCHGSRYSYEGTVIEGPALSGLERVDIEEGHA